MKILMYGIDITEVNSRYYDQKCSCYGYLPCTCNEYKGGWGM